MDFRAETMRLSGEPWRAARENHENTKLRKHEPESAEARIRSLGGQKIQPQMTQMATDLYRPPLMRPGRSIPNYPSNETRTVRPEEAAPEEAPVSGAVSKDFQRPSRRAPAGQIATEIWNHSTSASVTSAATLFVFSAFRAFVIWLTQASSCPRITKTRNLESTNGKYEGP
jgi:hypothetical protein